MKPIQEWMHYGLAVALVGMTFSGCAGTGGNSLVQRPKMPRMTKPADAPLSNAQISNVRFAMARTLEQQGDLEQAKQAYEQIVRQNSKDADAVHRLAIVYDRLGDSEKAEVHFKRALKVRPGNADVFCDLGYCYYLQGRWAESEMNIKQALALDPDKKRAHNNLGLLYAQVDRFRDSYEQFLLAGCTEAEAHTNMAFVMTLRGEWGAAHDEYNRALTLDPSLELAKKQLKVLNSSFAQAGTTAKEFELTSHSDSK